MELIVSMHYPHLCVGFCNQQAVHISLTKIYEKHKYIAPIRMHEQNRFELGCCYSVPCTAYGVSLQLHPEMSSCH